MIFASAILRNRRTFERDQFALKNPAHPNERREEKVGSGSRHPRGQGLVANWQLDPLTDRLECRWAFGELRAVFWSDPVFFERIEADLVKAGISGNPDLERILKAHRRWRRLQILQGSPARRAWHSAKAALQLATSRGSCLLARLLGWGATHLLRLVVSRLSLGRLSKRRARSLARLAKRLNHASFGILRWQLRRSLQHLG